MDDKAREDNVSLDEIEAEDAVSLPNKEVLSLLDVNANVDLGLDLAAPVDLAAAANLNVAAPIEAAASANVLSPGAEAVGVAQQHGTIDQTDSGKAIADAPQHAQVDQSAAGATSGGHTTGGTTPTSGGTTPTTGDTDASSGTTGTTGTKCGVGGAVSGAGDAVGGATGAAGNAVDGGVQSLLNGGSLLDANINVDAQANLAAPIDGAVAAKANVAAPIDAAVGANIGSPDSVAEAAAPQDVEISQNLDHVTADATADQDASVNQQ
ncbi:MAG: peptidoglycan-binding protein [Solirubrobacteraceae bacterium]